MQITLIHGDCLEEMKKIPDGSVDLTVTSPPYDNLRTYNGNNALWGEHVWRAAIQELYRITKEGGVVAWVVQDQTHNGHKSMTSFKQALFFHEVGFGMFETVIYRKYGSEGAWWNKRFRVDHEYVFILVKGRRPNRFNKESLKIPSKHGGKTMVGCASRKKDGTTQKARPVIINSMKCRGTIWEYLGGGDKEVLKRKHPATFPNALAEDVVSCFSQKNDIVLDPFMGSGTTGVACKNLNRNFIGIELDKQYFDLARERINGTPGKLL